MRILLSLLCVCLGGCATIPPGSGVEYHLGKKVIDSKDGDQIAVFTGDKRTDPLRAYRYSRLAAQEECINRNLLAFFIKSEDVSQETSYTRVTTTNNLVPIYGAGGSRPQYISQPTITSYPVTVKIPRYATPFRCLARFAGFKNSSVREVLSRELVSPVTGDFKGGILIVKAGEEKEFKDGDVIINIAGIRVENFSDMQQGFVAGIKKDSTGPVKMKVIRNKKMKIVSPQVQDITYMLEEIKKSELKQDCGLRTQGEPLIDVCKDVVDPFKPEQL